MQPVRLASVHRKRFDEVAALIDQFGREHFDDELTEFAIELWTRICRRKTLG